MSQTSKIRSPVQKSEKQIAHLSRNWKYIAHLIVNYLKIEKNRSRVSKSEKMSFLHPAGRFRLHFDSLRSKTIQLCTRFAGIPEASSHTAFSSGFSFHLTYIFKKRRKREKGERYFFLPVQHFRCSSRRQLSPPQRPIGPVPRACVVRHGATGLRCQVSMRHFPFVSDGSNFSRTTFGALPVQTRTLADRDEVR